MAITAEQNTKILKVVAGLFNAAPGAGFLSEFADAVAAGTSIQDLAITLANTSVFKTGIMGGQVTAEAQAAVLLNNFGLSTGTEAGDIANQYFIDLINQGMDFGLIVVAAIDYLDSPARDPLFDDTATLLNNKAAVSGYYSGDLALGTTSSSLDDLQNVLGNVAVDTPVATPEDLQAVIDDSGVAVGETFTLTTGVDNILGTTANDTIVGVFGGATGDTFTVADVVDGGAGTDTLALTAQDTTASPAAVTVNNIENIAVRDVVGATVNAQLFEDDPTISFNSTLAGLDSSVTNASTGSTFGLAGKGNLIVDFTDPSGSSDTVNLILSGVGTDADTRSTVDVGDGNSIEGVAIDATGTNFIELMAGTKAASITLSGDGTNNLDLSATGSVAAVMSLDASASTGTNTFVLGTTLNTTDVIMGGTGDDTVSVNFTLATQNKPSLTGVETLMADFDAAATLDLSGTADLTSVTLDDSSADQKITKAASTVATLNVTSQADTDNDVNFAYASSDMGALTMNIGSTEATAADITLDVLSLTNTTGATLNTVGTKAYDINGGMDIAGDQDALSINVGADATLNIAGIDVVDSSIGAFSVNVGEGGFFSGGVYVSGAGSLGDVTFDVAADAEAHTYTFISGGVGESVGNVAVNAIGENAYFSGYVNMVTSGGDGSFGDIALMADGDGAEIFYHTTVSGGADIGNISVTADNGAYVEFSISGNSQWSGFFDGEGAGDIGDVTVNVGEDSAVSGYITTEGSVGNVTVSLTGDNASGALGVYAEFMSGDLDDDGDYDLAGAGSIGDISLSIDGQDSNFRIEAEASGGDIGNVSFSLNGDGASGYLDLQAWESYVSGGEGVLGNIGPVTVTAGDDTAFDVDLAASNAIGDVTVTGGAGVSAGIFYLSGGGGDLGGTIGATSITLGDDAVVDVYFSGFNGESVGPITIDVGDDSTVDVTSYASSGAAYDDISITIGNDSDASVYFSGASGSVGNVTFTAGENSDVTFGFSGDANGGVGSITVIGGDADSDAFITLDDNSFAPFGGVDGSAWNGFMDVSLTAVTDGTSVNVGAGGSNVVGGQGADNIFFGAGDDTYEFSTTSDIDEIFSFAVADDVIDVSNFVTGAETAVADDAAAAAIVTNTAYVYADGSNATTAETIADFTDLTDVAAFLDASFSGVEAGTEHFVAVINDGGSTAYVYDGVLTDDGVESDEITLIGVVNADDVLTTANVFAS